MARRSDHTREELKTLALTSAREIVDTEGLHGLTVRSITNRMGYTVGTLYQLFRNLDDVVLHINAMTLDEMLEHITTASSKKNTLVAMACAYIDFSKTHFRRWSLLFEHRLPENTPMPDWYKEKISHIFNQIEKAIIAETVCSRQTASRAAHILWAALHGICTLSLSNKLDIGGPTSAEKLAELFLKNFLTGLKTHA